MIGPEQSIVFRIEKASRALPVVGPFEYLASFLVALFRGSQILANSLIKFLKKLHSTMQDLISAFVSGILADLTESICLCLI
jgi:hypothetical protein